MGRITPHDLWKSPVIRARLAEEANFECAWGLPNKSHIWCIVPDASTGDGSHTLKNYEANLQNCDPHGLQMTFAMEILKTLMSTSHFDGLWLVGFTHPPGTQQVLTQTDNCWGRLICIWFDQQGDPQYTVESDLTFIEQVKHGANYYVGLANEAHDQWKAMYGHKAMKSDMLLKDHQVKNAAMEALKK